MRHLFIYLLTTLICISSYGQVRQLVHLKNGLTFKASLVGQTNDSVFFLLPDAKKRDVPTSVAKNEIIKTQTRDVHFLDDEYDAFLSGSHMKLEYQKLCNNTDYGIHISGRQIDDEIIILLKLKFGNHSSIKSELILEDGDHVKIELSSGDTLVFQLYGAYMLKGQILYNFGYIKPDQSQIKELLDLQVNCVWISGRKCKVSDEYCVMRHLFAILEEKGFY
ncbi:MAG: hypothetical protein HQ565_09700 [Bacteroidetes bacterium]|nr:hypothetical protein [Bacteroidota bacterium]